jgi:predicted small secreted protein
MKKTAGIIAVFAIFVTILSSCATARSAAGSPIGESASIEDAVHDGYRIVQSQIPAKRRIAVLGFTGGDAREAAWASDELIHLLVKAKRHTIIDQRKLDLKIGEKNPSGEIKESSVKNIGYLLGAEVVLYGNISHYHNQIRFLNLKAMDVLSGEIIAITSERFTAS